MLVAVILTVEAHPMYQQIPVVQIPLLRMVRSADLDAARVQRQAGGEHHHDVVDFGAHTGHHGAFGWYADFPVHAHAN